MLRKIMVSILSMTLFMGMVLPTFANGDSTCDHDWSEWSYDWDDYPTCTETGRESRYCYICYAKESRDVPATGHDWSEWTEHWGNSATCTEAGQKWRSCYNCLAEEYKSVPATGIHDWWEFYETKYKKLNETYHYKANYECLECGKVNWKKAKHSWKYSSTVKTATPKKKGKINQKCICGATRTVNIKWKRGAKGCANYDFRHSDVYVKTKYITITTKKSLPGSVVKVKIGKKTYTKKIKSASKNIKIRIKNQKLAQSIKVYVYYKGKVIGKDIDGYKDVVWYSNRIDLGMTKKQVRYTWGVPKRKTSASGGWEFWHYDDGSYCRFKDGRLDYWYDTAG